MLEKRLSLEKLFIFSRVSVGRSLTLKWIFRFRFPSLNVCESFRMKLKKYVFGENLDSFVEKKSLTISFSQQTNHDLNAFVESYGNIKYN
jgi:hypothetical protein